MTDTSISKPLILLIGNYQVGNIGDDLLEINAREKILQIHPDAEIVVRPNSIRTFIAYYRLMRHAKKQRRPLAMVFGGGSIFQDESSINSCLYYLGLLKLAVGLGHPVHLWHIGMEPAQRELSKRILKKWLPLVSSASCRDQESADILIEYGLQPEQIIVTSDLAFLSGELSDSQTGDYIALAIKPSPIIPVLQRVIKQIPDAKMGVVMSKNEDKDIMTKLITKQNIKELQIVGKRFERFTPMPTLLITMRYHAAVWAALNSIPFIAISDGGKLENLARSLGQACINPYAPNSVPELLGALEDVSETGKINALKSGVKNLIKAAKSCPNTPSLVH